MKRWKNRLQYPLDKTSENNPRLTIVGTNGGLILLASKSFQFKFCANMHDNKLITMNYHRKIIQQKQLFL